MPDNIPADFGSADPGAELRAAAAIVRERYKEGSQAYEFWRVTAGIWERWAERMELGIELSPVAHAEFQAALYTARKYRELREGPSHHVIVAGPIACSDCGHVFATGGDEPLGPAELSGRILSHVCPAGEQ